MLQLNQSDIGRQVGIVTTSLHHGEEFISVTAEAPAAGQKGFNVQSLGACWTVYLRRYTLQALVGLASEDLTMMGIALVPDPKKAEVFAEVDKQKAQHQPSAHRLFLPNMRDIQFNHRSAISPLPHHRRDQEGHQRR